MSMSGASTPSKLNKMWKIQSGIYIAIGVMLAVAFTVTVTSTSMCSTSEIDPDYSLTPCMVSVVSGPIAVGANGYNYVVFHVPEGAIDPFLEGNFTSTGEGPNNNVIPIVLSQGDFVNWQHGRQYHTYYNRDLFPMVTGWFDVALPSGTTYYVVFGSATYMQAKTVWAQIDLIYNI
jgi:hypothetical protein